MKFICMSGILICLLGLTGCFSEKDANTGKAEGEEPSCCQVGTSRSKLFSGSTSPTSGEIPAEANPEATENSK